MMRTGYLFNFIYIPIKFKGEKAGQLTGYAFVNFDTEVTAVRFIEQFRSEKGFKDWQWHKVNEINPTSDADWAIHKERIVHGREELVAEWRNNPVMFKSIPEKNKPTLFDWYGNRLPFPGPQL